MRKTFAIAALIVSPILLAASCAGQPSERPDEQPAYQPPQDIGIHIRIPETPERDIGDDVPEFVRAAAMSAPRDVFVGIGRARMTNPGMARATAQARAFVDISRQLNTIVIESLYHDEDTGITERARLELSQSRLIGAVILDGDFIDGEYWMVVMLGRDGAIAEITAALPYHARVE